MCAVSSSAPPVRLLGHRIIPARAKGIAAEDTPDRERKTDKKAAFLKCLDGIG